MALRYQLENGLTVVFEEQHTAKVAAFQVWVRAGSADEREDQAGLAHLHEHMLFKGTARRGPGEIAQSIEAHGGEINAWTSFDQTVYHTVMASQFARMGLDVLADAVRSSAFDREELAREIEVVCEEIKRSTDAPGRRASRDLFSTAYQQHPYLRPVIGWEQTVRSFSREKVLEFYERHYTPKNMVLAIVGDLTEQQVRAWVQELFGGDWGRPYAGPVKRAQETARTGRRFLLRPDDVKEAYLNVAFPICSVNDEDTPALDVLSMIVGQGDASRLSLEVKRKRRLVNEVHTYAYTPKDPGIFTLSMTLPPDALEPAMTEALRVLMQLKTSPVPADELATVKAIVEAEAVYQRESVQGLARKLGFYEAGAGGIEQEARYYEKVAGLTPEVLQQVAQKYLDLSKATVTGLIPQAVKFTEKDANDVLDVVAKETPSVPPERKRAKAEGSTPLRVTSGHTRADGKLIVETLPSGCKVVIKPESAVPLFAVRAAVQGGLRYETVRNNGISTLLARTMTRGTQSHEAEEISHLIDDLAGSLSATAGRNSITVRGEFLSKHFHRAFDLFTEVLTRPTFPEGELERERALLLQDIATREDKPSGLAFDLFHRTLFEHHPYRMQVAGEKESVSAITRANLVDWHGKYLDPSQLTLAFVGDVKVDEVMELCNRAFGKSFGKAARAPQVLPEVKPSAPRLSKKELKRAQTHLVLGFRGAKIDDPWRRALEVLSTVLSGQGGRLFIELRDKRSMAYSVSSYTVEGIDPGYFAVYMGTSPEKVDAALEGIRTELTRLRDEKITPAELDRARQHMIGTHEIGLQRNGARAALLALDVCYGLPLDEFERYAETVNAVTAEEVQKAAQDVIDFNASALAVVGP